MVGPDDRHPFVIRDLHIWDAHWGFTPAAPGLLVDGLRFGECRYGFWRPLYFRHAYRNVVNFRVAFPPAYESGERAREKDYPLPLRPVDDRPPITVITRIDTRDDGRIVVRGSTLDDGDVKSVQVNGRPASSLGLNFQEWEAVLEPETSALTTFVAAALDAAGNAELSPHRLTIRLPR
jgi:hypothetical protein